MSGAFILPVLLAAALARDIAPGPAPGALPPIPFPLLYRSEPRLVVWDAPSRAVCDSGGEAVALAPLDADPVATSVNVPGDVGPTGARATPSPVTPPAFDFTFDIAASGRTLTVRRVMEPAVSYTPRQPYVGDEDLQAAMAAWRFPAGAARGGCRVHLSGRVLSYVSAGAGEIWRATALGRLSDPHARDAALPGADCYRGKASSPRVFYSVAVDEMAEAPGVRSWAVLTYDVDARGETRNVSVAASSGRKNLDAQALATLKRSRFSPLEKRGCVSRYFTAPGTTPLPDAPPAPSQEAAGCPGNPQLASTERPFYPPALLRRRVEGYVLLRYDIAPWGGIGNVQVLRSEPVAAFGEAARGFLSSSRAAASEHGATGCLKPVRFRLGDDQGETEVTFRGVNRSAIGAN